MSLDIHNFKSGMKIKYSATNGTDFQRNTYEGLGMNSNDTYTLKGWVIEDWYTGIYLEEFGDKMFNSVCFNEAD